MKIIRVDAIDVDCQTRRGRWIYKNRSSIPPFFFFFFNGGRENKTVDSSDAGCVEVPVSGKQIGGVPGKMRFERRWLANENKASLCE